MMNKQDVKLLSEQADKLLKVGDPEEVLRTIVRMATTMLWEAKESKRVELEAGW